MLSRPELDMTKVLASCKSLTSKQREILIHNWSCWILLLLISFSKILGFLQYLCLQHGWNTVRQFYDAIYFLSNCWITQILINNLFEMICYLQHVIYRQRILSNWFTEPSYLFWLTLTAFISYRASIFKIYSTYHRCIKLLVFHRKWFEDFRVQIRYLPR